MVSAWASPWHHRCVYFVLLMGAVAILAGVVVVAMGRGGEIARFDRDLPLTPPRITVASDLPLLRLPVGLFGYQERATRVALDAAARLLAEQDAEIARLRQTVTRLSASAESPGEPAAPGPAAGQAWPQS